MSLNDAARVLGCQVLPQGEQGKVLVDPVQTIACRCCCYWLDPPPLAQLLLLLLLLQDGIAEQLQIDLDHQLNPHQPSHIPPALY
jgi:hypothetical protein